MSRAVLQELKETHLLNVENQGGDKLLMYRASLTHVCMTSESLKYVSLWPDTTHTIYIYHTRYFVFYNNNTIITLRLEAIYLSTYSILEFCLSFFLNTQCYFWLTYLRMSPLLYLLNLSYICLPKAYQYSMVSSLRACMEFPLFC